MFHEHSLTSSASFPDCSLGCVRGGKGGPVGMSCACNTCWAASFPSPFLRTSLVLRAIEPNSMTDVRVLLDTARAQNRLYQEQGSLSNLNASINALRAALRLVHPQDPVYPDFQSNLAIGLDLRARYLYSIDDVSEAIELQKLVLQRTPVDNPELYAGRLCDLARFLMFRFERRRNPDDVEAAMDFTRRAVESASQGLREMPKYMAYEAEAMCRLARFKSLPDLLAKGISRYEQALAFPSEDHIWRPHAFSNFAYSLILRSRSDKAYQHDADRAVAFARQAVTVARDRSPQQPISYSWLSLIHFFRYLENGSIDDLDEAIFAARKTVKPLEADHALWMVTTPNLATYLVNRFEARGSLTDLDEAIGLLRQVLPVLPDTDPTASARHSSLGQAYKASYGRRGRAVELDRAVEAHRKAVLLAPPDEKAYYTQLLGDILLDRSIHHQSPQDLNKAIERLTEAIPESEDADRNVAFADLANALTLRAKSTGNAYELKRAVNLYKQAVHTPKQMKFHAGILSMYGCALQQNFLISEDPDDLTEAVRIHKEAVNLAPQGHSKLHLFLIRLAIAHRDRFKLLRNPEDLEASIHYAWTALSVTGTNHPLHASHQFEFAQCLINRQSGTSNPADIMMAIDALRTAAKDEASVPKHRLDAAVLWANWSLNLLKDPGRALKAYQTAIGLLPHVAWLGLDQVTRYQTLHWSSLGTDAAACAISAGQLDLAVEFLEQGRSVLWNSSLQLRQEQSELQSMSPRLAERLQEVGRALELSLSRNNKEFGSEESEKEAERHRRLADEWDGLVEEVRRLPGFESFLACAPFEELCAAASEGPVVLINISRYRCDALIVTAAGTVNLVPLPGASQAVVNQLSNNLADALRVPKDAHGSQFLDTFLLETMDRLWVDIAAPIWDVLQHFVPAYSGQRVWLIPTGSLASLPLHAAGPISQPGVGFPSLFVASYTTSLRALIRARGSAPGRSRAANAPFRMLAVSLPSAPGKVALPDSQMELNAISRHIPPQAVTVMSGEKATIPLVTVQLKTHNFLHLCSHGEHDSDNPYDSSIVLYDGGLRLKDIIQLRLARADFAFLSACHTARIDPRSPDEWVHLASGLHLAGYRSIIATLWGIADIDGPQITDHIYAYFTRNGQTPRHTDAAKALHYAVSLLRGAGVPAFRWVPFVHIGV